MLQFKSNLPNTSCFTPGIVCVCGKHEYGAHRSTQVQVHISTNEQHNSLYQAT